MDDFLAAFKMGVDKTEDSVVEVELHHHSAFPAVANQVFDHIVLLDVTHEQGVFLLHKNCQEYLAFTHHLNHVELMLQVAFDIAHLFDLLTTALLPTIGDHIIVAVIREKLVHEDVLGLLGARMVPRDSHDVEGDLAVD